MSFQNFKICLIELSIIFDRFINTLRNITKKKMGYKWKLLFRKKCVYEEKEIIYEEFQTILKENTSHLRGNSSMKEMENSPFEMFKFKKENKLFCICNRFCFVIKIPPCFVLLNWIHFSFLFDDYLFLTKKLLILITLS